MIFLCQFSICTLDGCVIRIPVYAKNLIIISLRLCHNFSLSNCCELKFICTRKKQWGVYRSPTALFLFSSCSGLNLAVISVYHVICRTGSTLSCAAHIRTCALLTCTLCTCTCLLYTSIITVISASSV